MIPFEKDQLKERKDLRKLKKHQYNDCIYIMTFQFFTNELRGFHDMIANGGGGNIKEPADFFIGSFLNFNQLKNLPALGRQRINNTAATAGRSLCCKGHLPHNCIGQR